MFGVSDGFIVFGEVSAVGGQSPGAHQLCGRGSSGPLQPKMECVLLTAGDLDDIQATVCRR